MNEDYRIITRSADVPDSADFALVVSGDEMEPYIRCGDTIYISRREELCEMDVGVFSYGGRILLRQWCEDCTGTLQLLCANPRCQRDNLSLPPEHRGECICLGRVLLPHPLPPPVYR